MDKNNKLKNTVLWTIYVSILLISIFTLICIIINVIAPTFFPERDISGFIQYVNIFGIILSFLSAGLGIFSIWQANVSNKQVSEILQSLQSIEHDKTLSKELIRVVGKIVDDGLTTLSSRAKTDGSWEPDKNDK